MVGRAELLFSEVLNALRLLAERKCGVGATNGGTNVHESRHLITDLEGLLQKEKSIFEVWDRFQILSFIFKVIFM